MERTSGFLRINLRKKDTFEREYYRKERFSLKWHNNSNHWGARISSGHNYTQFQTEPYQLRRFPERRMASSAYCNKEIQLRQRELKIQHLNREILRQDRTIQCLRDIFEYKLDEVKASNEQLANELLETDEQLYNLGDQLQQTESMLREAEVENKRLSIILQSMKFPYSSDEIDRRDLEIKTQQEILYRQNTEIHQRNEYYVKIGLQERDKQLSAENEQMQQILKIRSEENIKFKTHITSLEAQLKSLAQKVKELEKMLDSKKSELHDCKELLQNTMKKKDNYLSEQSIQVHKPFAKLQEAEAKMIKDVSSLKERNQYLQEEVERLNLKVKHQQETLESKKMALNDRDKRQENTVMRQKDDQISDLRHQLKQTLDRKESEMNEIIASLKKNMQKLENEVEQRDMTIKDLDYKKKETSDRNELLEKKVKELYKERDQGQHAFEKVQEKEVEKEGIIASLKTEVNHLKEDMEHLNLKIKHLEEELNSKTIGIPVKKEPNRDVMEMESKIIELTDQLDQTLTKLHETRTELDDTKTRLSKAMGNMLTDNNPNIADLSDKNRPTKLSERYAELYDNQWTDAFDILEKHFHVEENAIAALLLILKDVMTYCRNRAHEQMEDLRRVLALSNDKEDGGISTDLGKLLKDCRKALASVALGNLHKMYMSHVSKSTDKTIGTALQVSSFTKECLEVCWFMAIQDPPVVFAPELREGSKFNTDLFKPYTSSGTHVDYVVWPALLLHEGGPILAKGVAQGKGKKST